MARQILYVRVRQRKLAQITKSVLHIQNMVGGNPVPGLACLRCPFTEYLRPLAVVRRIKQNRLGQQRTQPANTGLQCLCSRSMAISHVALSLDLFTDQGDRLLHLDDGVRGVTCQPDLQPGEQRVAILLQPFQRAALAPRIL